MSKSYVVRTDALGRTYYFAGAIELAFGPAPVISGVIFDALQFPEKSAAEQCIKDCEFGPMWTISECESGASANVSGAA